MELTLQDLPTEILDLTLQYLPLSDLLSFARTSHANYELSKQALTSLDLAVFPRRIHSLLAFFDASNQDDDEDEDCNEDPPVSKYWNQRGESDRSLYQIGLTTSNTARPQLSRSNTPPSNPTLTSKDRKRKSQSQPAPAPPTPLSLRTAEITTQNTLANQVLTSSSLTNLRDLTLRLYDLTSSNLAHTLATHFPSLQTLNLDLSHPYIHDTTLPARYWKETVPTGSPIWNALSGIGDIHSSTLQLRSLRSLRINRSGITSAQLRSWIHSNPDLRELRLSLCRGVDVEFLTWLAEDLEMGVCKLEILRFVDCGMLEINDHGFEVLKRIARTGVVKELNFKGCRGVTEEGWLRFARPLDGNGCGCGIAKVVSPKGVVVVHKQIQRGNDHTDILVQRNRLGSVSPALTVSDGMVGSGSYFGEKIEVDPDEL